MELVGGIEPPTSSLPRMRSTPELHEQLSLHAVPQWWQYKTVSRPGKAGRELNTYFQSVKKNITCFAFFFELLHKQKKIIDPQELLGI